MRASARQSAQLADQRSGTRVAERPDEQLKPNRPSFNALELCIARRSLMDEVAGRSSKAGSVVGSRSLNVRAGERSLHFAADADGGVVRVVFDIGP